MYILNTAYTRDNRRNSIWVERDLTNVPASTLLAVYADVWLFITYLNVTTPRAVHVHDVSSWLSEVPSNVTVQQWLTSLGNTTLPFSEVTPQFIEKTVNYANAWHAGYDIQPIERGGAFNPVGSRYDKEDLIVNHDELTPELIAKNALFSVNGLYHMCDYNAEGAYVLSGNTSLRIANDNQIGIHSFFNVGELQYVPITQDMVVPAQPGNDLIKGVYITIPETVDVTNKTVLMVIGGYLHVLDSIYTPVSDTTYRINPSKLALLERIFDSKNRIDLSPLGLTDYEFNPDLLETESILTNDVILKYLTLEQSFFLIVDCDTFFQELIPLDFSGIADRYIDFIDRNLPVIGPYGRMVEHHRIHEDGLYVIAASRTKRFNYHFYTYDWSENLGVDSGLIPNIPFQQGNVFIRKMGTQK